MVLATDQSLQSPTLPFFGRSPDWTVGSHVWLANLAASSREHSLPTALQRPPSFDRATHLEAACQGRQLTRMLKGVVTNMHCLALLSLETGMVPYLGPAQHIDACYLEALQTSQQPPEECTLNQRGLVKRLLSRMLQRSVLCNYLLVAHTTEWCPLPCYWSSGIHSRPTGLALLLL